MIVSNLFRFTKKGLIHLFLVTSFPIHIWSIFLILEDMNWILERSPSYSDIFGYASYALVVAFAESVFVFLCLLPLSLLTPKKWQEEQLISQLGILSFTTTLWFIMIQLYDQWADSNFKEMIKFIVNQDHPVRIFYISATVVILLLIASYILPMYLINRSEKSVKTISIIFERIAILSSIYIVFDILGIFYILIRNLR